MVNFLNWLLPKETKFFRMFEKQAMNVLDGIKIFDELIKDYEKLSDTRKQHLVTKIKGIEEIGDKIAHNIIFELNKSFITPFDKEDIYNIAVILDDLIDLINAASIRLSIFKIKNIPLNMVALSNEGSKAINVIYYIIQNIEKLNESQRWWIEIHSFENKADEIYHDALANILNDKNISCVDIIKYKEIYDILEKVLDKCENFTQIIEGIIVKHG